MKSNSQLKRSVILCFIFLLTSKIAFTCSCIGITSFCETTFNNPNIAVVEVINKNTPDVYTSFDVEVKQVISGVINEQNLSINYQWSTCTEFANVSVGDELIINFSATNNLEEAPYPAIGFGNCAVNYLTLKNNIVSGNIYGVEKMEISFDNFLSDFNECTGLSLVDPNVTLLSRIYGIVENPVMSELNIRKASYIEEPFDIFIYNNQGKLIKTVSNISNNIETVNVEAFSPGIYICAFKVRNLVFSKKFIKI